MASNGVRVLVLAIAGVVGTGCEQLPPGLKEVLEHLRRGHPTPSDAGFPLDARPPVDAGTVLEVTAPEPDSAPDLPPPEPDTAPDTGAPSPTCTEACTPGARRCGPEGLVMQECTQRDDACPDWAEDPRCVPCDPDTFVFCPGSGSGGFP